MPFLGRLRKRHVKRKADVRKHIECFRGPHKPLRNGWLVATKSPVDILELRKAK